jgi:hypothetical protein
MIAIAFANFLNMVSWGVFYGWKGINTGFGFTEHMFPLFLLLQRLFRGLFHLRIQ